MQGGRGKLARFQSDFYCQNYHKILRALIVNMVLIVALVVLIIYLILTITPPDYYGSTPIGQIIKMEPIQND